MAQQKIRSFTDLDAWKQAHQLVLQVYEHTKNFPKEEQFGLTNQIRRAAVSVPSNIAEGFARGTKADKTQFYRVALGSLAELQSQLLIARDVQYLGNKEFMVTAGFSMAVRKLLNGLIKSASNK